MTHPDQPESDVPARQRKDRTVLGFTIGVFVAAFVGVFIWNDALMPTLKEGELHSHPVQGWQGPKA